MLQWLRRHFGIQIVDFSLSMWIVLKRLPYQHEDQTRTFGFTIGPWFLIFDRNYDVAWMLHLKTMGWISNFSWYFGDANRWAEPIIVEVRHNTILPPPLPIESVTRLHAVAPSNFGEEGP